jgi:hypothetical protein
MKIIAKCSSEVIDTYQYMIILAADRSSFWGEIWGAVALAGNGGKRALVRWPVADSFVGLCLELAGPYKVQFSGTVLPISTNRSRNC